MFKMLQIFVQLIQREHAIESDKNSLNDFEKEVGLENSDIKVELIIFCVVIDRISSNLRRKTARCTSAP